MAKLQDILNGWGNELKDKFGLLSPDVKAISEHRLSKCDDCYLRQEDRCSSNKQDFAVRHFMYKGKFRLKGQLYYGCGCNIVAKSKCTTANCQCPLGKWDG